MSSLGLVHGDYLPVGVFWRLGGLVIKPWPYLAESYGNSAKKGLIIDHLNDLFIHQITVNPFF